MNSSVGSTQTKKSRASAGQRTRTEFEGALNKNRWLAVALADAFQQAEGRRQYRYGPHNYLATIRKVTKAAGIEGTNWAAQTSYGDSSDHFVIDYDDPDQGFSTPWIVEQNYLSRGDASGNYFTERELNPRYQHDAELIYTAYDGVAPIVKAAAEALVRARRERREQQRASSVVIDPDAYCFGGGLAAVTQYGNPAGSCCACGKVVRVSKNGKAPRHKPLILSSTREAS